MEDGLLSLKWNNHRSTFFHILSTLREKGTYTDATLACEGEFFPVHKLVMSTCSDYFADMFERTQCKSPIVVLKDIKKSDLGALLDYMYVGEVDVRQSDLAGLIKAAECLRIKGLAVPDEDPGKVSKAQKTNNNSNSNSISRVPDHHRRTNSSSPPPTTKRQRRDSGSGSISHTPPSNSSASASVSNSRTTSVPSQSSVTPPVIKGGSGEPLSPAVDNSPDILPVEQIKVEKDDEGGANTNSSSAQLDHRGGGGGGVGSDLEDDSGGGMADDDMTDFSQFTQEDIEKQEHDQMDYPDQLAGPSGLQGGSSVLNWGDGEEGSFPQNLFGNEDPNQQQVTRKNESDLLSPLSLPHPTPDPCKCDVCGREFSWQWELQIHTQVHHQSSDTTKPYGCSFCSYRSALKGNLQKHERIHTDEKPFSCGYCSYKCSQKSSLIVHERIHTGERPYKCNQCPYSATQQSTLRRHLQVHSRDKTQLPVSP